MLHAVFTFTPADQVLKEQWLSRLAAAISFNRIKCMPRLHRSCIIYRQVNWLIKAMTPL
jgi:hypothetical protein